MWFRLIDYPKFVDFLLKCETLDDGFNRAGFKTYQIDSDRFPIERHWLDEEEFTLFVLRYS